MKKQIKFRTWIDNEMIYLPMAGLQYYDFEGSYALSFVVDGYKEFWAHENYSGDSIKERLNKAVLMEFTGREDAQINGVEVWEGDIIENCDTKALQIVYWNENEVGWYCRYDEDETRVVSLATSLGNLNKVIGNIYEHSSLLKSVGKV